MSLITRMRRQKAVYWKQRGSDHHGKSAFEKPVEIDCRWEGNTLNVMGDQGEMINFNSTVYVDREMKIGDVLKQGELESDTPDDPGGEDDTFIIQRFVVTPNPRATESLMIAYV